MDWMCGEAKAKVRAEARSKGKAMRGYAVKRRGEALGRSAQAEQGEYQRSAGKAEPRSEPLRHGIQHPGSATERRSIA